MIMASASAPRQLADVIVALKDACALWSVAPAVIVDVVWDVMVHPRAEACECGKRARAGAHALLAV